jgi:hypothetical protein
MKTLIQIVFAGLLTLAALADDIRTSAERGQVNLPAADYVVVIRGDTAIAYSSEDLDDPIAGARLDGAPRIKNDLRASTLEFMLKVAEHDNDSEAMFLIITDEQTPSEYKAFIQRLPPGKITPIKKPTGNIERKTNRHK